MSKPTNLLDDPDFINDLLYSELSGRAIAAKWNVAKTTVNKHRNGLRKKDGLPKAEKIKAVKLLDPVTEVREVNADGSRVFEISSDRTVDLNDWRAWIEASGDNPDDFNPGVRSTKTTNADGSVKYWNQLRASPKLGVTKDKRVTLDMDELYAIIENDSAPAWSSNEALVNTYALVIADLQVGKVSTDGGTPELMARCRASLDAAILEIKRLNPYEVLVIDAGDIVENLGNVSTQIGTNDADLTEQIRIARRFMLQVLREVAPLVPVVQYGAVASNHSRVRMGLKNPVGGENDDYGVEISYQLEDALDINPDAYGHVHFTRTEGTNETIALDTYGNTRIGVAHGHQANNQNALGSWWQGQALGRMPIADADILVVGHHHNMRVETVGDKRWILGAPTSDNGSAWFTNKTGHASRTGFLGFSVQDGNWSDLKIL